MSNNGAAKKKLNVRQGRSEDDFSFFDLDEHNLVEEWVRQPRLYFDYARKLADAKSNVERASAELDLTRAETDRDVRIDPAAYGIEAKKVTEPAIKAAVAKSAAVKAATAVYIEAKHAADVVQAAVNALDHRKRALEKLVDLLLANYYSKPREPEGSGRQFQRASDSASGRRGLRRRGD